MGKSLKNSIAPDDICQEYGCDTLRLYEMYLGPLDQSKLWRTRDIVGIHRFLQRLWRNFVADETDAWLVVDEPADGSDSPQAAQNDSTRDGRDELFVVQCGDRRSN